MNQIIADTELFPLGLKLDEYIKKITLYEYKIQAESSVIELFSDIAELTNVVAKKIKGIFQNTVEGPIVLTTKQLDQSESKIIVGEGHHVDLISLSEGRSIKTPSDMGIIYKLLYGDLRSSIENSGFRVRGYSAFKTSEEITIDTKITNQFISKIAERVGVYPGFYFRLRQIHDTFFLQISPKSTLEFKTDLYDLMNEENFSDEFLEELCQRIRLSSGKVVSLRTILQRTCNSQLSEPPYNGLSFTNYIKTISDARINHVDARLLVVLQQGRDNCTYASTEGSKPILDFISLSHLEHGLFSNINSKLKSQSAKRRDLALQYVKDIKLVFNGQDVKIGPRKSFTGNYLDLIPFSSEIDAGRFFGFRDPIVSFKDKDGNIKNASKNTDDLGAPQDLLKNKGYRPFTAPHEINIDILAVKGIEDTAEKLKTALSDIDGIINLQEVFGCKFNFNKIISINSEQDTTDYPILTCDCAIIVGRKNSPDSHSLPTKTYTNAEVALLEQGIPAQYVIHDPSSNPYYDNSLEKKIRSSPFLFGLSLQILSKVGGNSMILSSETTKDFVTNSVVMGYNIARVFEPLEKSIKNSTNTLDLIKTSIPLSASVSIMNQSGSEILHQNPHVVPDEGALFRGERGQMIFDQLPETCENIIIHKDGMFRKNEIDDLNKLKKHAKIIPVSVVTSMVPRISTSLQAIRYLPRAGTFLPLSNNEFLLSTTLISSAYDPFTKGWPNPLLIVTHEMADNKISSEIKWRVLSQLWSLTRAHPASMIPTRRPLSIHYSNKMAKFIRKTKQAQPTYFKKFADKKNRFGFYPKPFL